MMVAEEGYFESYLLILLIILNDATHNYSPINFLAIFSALSFVYVFNNTRGSL